MSSERRLVLADVEATHALAAEYAQQVCPGDVLALQGELGAGKTEFVRGLVRALGAPEDVSVCSPSYLLLNQYSGGRLDVAHFDAYFMASEDDLERAGLQDLRRDGHVIVVEWADRVAAALPADAHWIALKSAGADHNARVARCRRGAFESEGDR